MGRILGVRILRFGSVGFKECWDGLKVKLGSSGLGGLGVPQMHGCHDTGL